MSESFKNINEAEFKQADNLLYQRKILRAFNIYRTSKKNISNLKK